MIPIFWAAVRLRPQPRYRASGAPNPTLPHSPRLHPRERVLTCMGVCSAVGLNALSSGPWILLEDLSLVYSDLEAERAPGKHGHKKRKLADGREKTTVRGGAPTVRGGASTVRGGAPTVRGTAPGERRGPHGERRGPHGEGRGPHRERGPDRERRGPDRERRGPHRERRGPHGERRGPQADGESW